MMKHRNEAETVIIALPLSLPPYLPTWTYFSSTPPMRTKLFSIDDTSLASNREKPVESVTFYSEEEIGKEGERKEEKR